MIPKIRDARYAGTVYNELERLPQVAFAGRSNVGKSSLINTLLNRRTLVKTSKQPGKTRNINYFRVDMVDHQTIYMVDLPGYGYARVHHSMKSAWEELAERYFHENRDLKLLMVLIDIRRDLESDEYLIIDLARKASIMPLLVATKADKLNYGDRQKRIREIARASGMEPLPASSHNRLGMDEIWQHILRETA